MDASPQRGRAAQLERRYRTLLEINNAIVTSLRRDELLHAICEALRPVLPFDQAAINIYDPESDLLRILALKIEDKTRLLVGSTLNREENASGWVLENQKTLRRHDLEKEAQFAGERLMVSEGLRSLCIVPLTCQRKASRHTERVEQEHRPIFRCRCALPPGCGQPDRAGH